ncbi:MAG: glycosyltransferase [Planctomycetota bacterium]
MNSIEPKSVDLEHKQKVVEFFDVSASKRVKYGRRNRYYHRLLAEHFRFMIPEGKRVLEIGCADGRLLSRLNPSRGLGIDISPAMIERAREHHPDEALQFEVGDIEAVTFNETFDFVIMSDLFTTLADIQKALENIRSACDENTRVIIHSHSMLWEPLLRVVQRVGLKMPAPPSNWISPSDIDNFVKLAGYEQVRSDRRMLMPKYIPLLSGLLNRFVAPLPLFNALCLTNFVVLRCRPEPAETQMSTAIVIPCRNERGNIRDAVERIPAFGGHQEIIFVDGHSTDGTVDEIRQVMADFPNKDITVYVQPGKGKGDAVRHAFAQTRADILMILDADLTVPPEDLPKFYRAIATDKGDFINGSRLVYPLEGQAMRFLNILGNKFFSVVLSWLTNCRLKDTLCGTKVLRREAYDKIAAGRSYFGDFDPFGDFDLLFGAAKQNLKIVEVPIRYRDRLYGSTNISRFRHGLLLLRMSWFAFRKIKTH